MKIYNEYINPQLRYYNLELEGFICGSGEVDESEEHGVDILLDSDEPLILG